jgi:ankyrin repeat protein
MLKKRPNLQLAAGPPPGAGAADLATARMAMWCEEKEKARRCCNVEALEEIFRKHCSENCGSNAVVEASVIAEDRLGQALQDCGQTLSRNEIKKLIHLNAANIEAGGLAFEEFVRAVLTPSRLEEWISSLHLPRIFALCFPMCELEVISQLDPESIESIIGEFAHRIKNTFEESVERYKHAIKSMTSVGGLTTSGTNESSSSDTDKFTCVGGDVNEFHKSLSDRMGWPSSRSNFLNMMRIEHTAELTFRGNANQIINPKDEFEYVIGEKSLDTSSEGKRVIRSVAELLQIEKAKKANLKEEEVTAIVLYTGPLYHAYNRELRKEGNCERYFKTTIFVLGSALEKLVKEQRIPHKMCLYRGLGAGMDFPDFFYHVNEDGCKGITEYGFLSTTKNRNMAIKYSAVGDKNRIPVIIEMEVGSVDRGADISDFSQYRHQQEFLWPPGTFLEPCSSHLHVERERVVKIVRVRPRCSLKIMTIEELLSKKKTIHLSGFDFLLREVEQVLSEDLSNVANRLERDNTLNCNRLGDYVDEPICSASKFIQVIMDQCKEVREKHEKVEPEEYAVDEKFKELVCSMLDTVMMAKSKLLGYIKVPSLRIWCYLHSSLKACHRERIASLRLALPLTEPEKTEGARNLCSVAGLLSGSMDVLNDLGEPTFVTAAAEGRPGWEIRLRLDAGAEMNSTDEGGGTALHAAARYGHEDTIAVLCDANADVNIVNMKNGQTAAWVAAQNGQEACLELLINRKSDVDQGDSDGASPAFVAALRGHRGILKVLEEAGANLDACAFDGCTPMFMASYEGAADCVEFLIRAGANTALPNRVGSTPLMIAAQQGRAPCLSLLLASSAAAGIDEQDENGQSAVYAAAESGHEDCISLLYENGADVTAADSKGVTPERIAAEKGHAGCAELLRRLSADDAGATLPGLVEKSAGSDSQATNGDGEQQKTDACMGRSPKRPRGSS